MAWVWGTIPGYNGPVPPRLVARPLPGGHRPDRGRRHARPPGARSTTCGRASRRPTAASRRTPTSTARRTGGDLQLDEVADPILLAWQLGRTDADDLEHVAARRGLHPRQRADHAGALGERRRATRRRASRAEIAGLVCAAQIARPQRRGDRGRALPLDRRRLAHAVDRWTVTTNGPLSQAAVLPAPDERRRTRTPARRTRSPTAVRRSTSAASWTPSFLELVRLGVQARRRPRRRLDAAGRRPRARRHHARGAVLAPLQARRLRRDPGRRPVPGTGNARAAVAAACRRARGVRARRRRPGTRGAGAAGRSTRRDRRHRHDG